MSTTRIFLDSIPKTGAHLLERALDGLGCPRGQKPIGASVVLGRNGLLKSLLRAPWTSRDAVPVGVEVAVAARAGWLRRRLRGVAPGTYVRGHVQYSEAFASLLEEGGFRLLHLVRDPRDVAVSHAHYVLDRRRHVFHSFYRRLGSFEERLAFSISGGWVPGVGYLVSIGERFRSMEGWERYPDRLTLRFEDLVGAGGGGEVDRQRRTLGRLAAWMGRGEEEGEALAGEIFGDSSTFRKGQIGGWREAFGEEHRELFERVAGDALERWGYD